MTTVSDFRAARERIQIRSAQIVVLEEGQRAGVTKAQIMGQERSGRISRARQRIAARLRDEIGCSWHQIGLLLGGRSAATVSYLCVKGRELLREEGR